MRKLFYLLFVTTCVLSLSTSAMAYEISKTEDVDHHKMWYKFKRGVINILTSPVELPKQIKAEVMDSDNKGAVKVIAALGGTAKGLVYSLGRFGSGLWDSVSFNLAVPENYEPLMKPEYVYEHKSKE